MNILDDSSLKEVIEVFKRREFDHGKYLPNENTFYKLFYASLDDNKKSPSQVIIEGRAEMFLTLPSGIVWKKAEISGDDLPNIQVINSAGWNKLPTHFQVKDRHTAIFTNPIPEYLSTRKKIEEIASSLDHPQFTSNSKDPHFILITENLNGPYTILEGNHTFLAFIEKYRENGPFPTLPIIIGYFPPLSNYPFLRPSTPYHLNKTPMKPLKTPEEVATYIFPSFVKTLF